MFVCSIWDCWLSAPYCLKSRLLFLFNMKKKMFSNFHQWLPSHLPFLLVRKQNFYQPSTFWPSLQFQNVNYYELPQRFFHVNFSHNNTNNSYLTLAPQSHYFSANFQPRVGSVVRHICKKTARTFLGMKHVSNLNDSIPFKVQVRK